MHTKMSGQCSKMENRCAIPILLQTVDDYFFPFGLVSFIGSPQQIKSHGVQPHSSSTTTTAPHSSHLYFVPFFAILFSPPFTFVYDSRTCNSMKYRSRGQISFSFFDLKILQTCSGANLLCFVRVGFTVFLSLGMLIRCLHNSCAVFVLM